MASVGSFASVFVPAILIVLVAAGLAASLIAKRREARRIKAHFRNKRD